VNGLLNHFFYCIVHIKTLLSCWQSDSHNLKYMGIDALGRLIKLSPEIAEQHQLAVIDCLEVRLLPLSACDTNHFVGVRRAIGFAPWLMLYPVTLTVDAYSVVPNFWLSN
jgi:hypothetical protein